MYTGNGSPSAGWPDVSSWLSFEELWSANAPDLGQSCETAFGVPNNTPEETADIKSALIAESAATGVDKRFALAIMMQESLGCSKVQTTNYGVKNPGLYQSHDGTGTCYNVNPCPSSEITQMVKDGLDGTAAGDGLKQCLGESSASGAEAYYQAARIYNSGSLPANGDLGSDGATNCYCSDVANRLMGWATGASGCTL